MARIKLNIAKLSSQLIPLNNLINVTKKLFVSLLCSSYKNQYAAKTIKLPIHYKPQSLCGGTQDNVTKFSFNCLQALTRRSFESIWILSQINVSMETEVLERY